MQKVLNLFMVPVIALAVSSCRQNGPEIFNPNDTIMMKVNDFATFKLTTDLGKLSSNEKKMIPILIEIAGIMDDIFWQEAYGNKDILLDSLTDEGLKKLVMINYGPWERLNNNQPFIQGTGPKPPGANFYPVDMTEDEFESLVDPNKTSLYTLIRRNAEGSLTVVPYHEAFSEQITKASDLLLKAAELADDPGLKRYLELRSKALLDDQYFMSDLAWMEMKDNTIDFVAGPIESYEDQLFGYKASHEAYILIKDKEWSDKLSHFSLLLPELQKSLPVEEPYKAETPGSSSDLGAYDVVFYAGDCNAGSKTIAINLPNDERVQAEKGSRRLQLKNAMQAKFDKILIPIANELIAPGQVSYVTFDAFFSNTMFHEIAHGLGPMNTINGKGSVRESLKENYTTIEEGKADILGLYLEGKLKEMGEIESDLMQEYTTFLAGIFRSIRFGASNAHGKANLIRFNYFKEFGAFTVTEDGKYSVNFDKMAEAVNSLSSLIITMQGDGDYERAAEFIKKYSVLDASLEAALKRIEEKDIPVDIVFEQGMAAIGL